MIRFDNVWKRYPNGREAVFDLTLAIDALTAPPLT
jgi:ABC-type ATPase involved in cell division